MKFKIFSILILLSFLFLFAQRSPAYYGSTYGSNRLYGVGYTPGLLGNSSSNIYGLYGGLNGSTYGLGNLYGGLGLGTGFGGLNSLGLYGTYGSGNLYGGLGLGTGLYGGNNRLGLYGTYGLGNFYGGLGLGTGLYGSMYGLGGLYGSYGIGTYGLSGLGGFLGTSGLELLFANMLLNPGRSDAVVSPRAAAALTQETWVGQWVTVNSYPLPALPIIGNLLGPMNLSIVEDLVIGVASGHAILQSNTYLSLGVNLTGTASFGLTTFQGEIQAPLVPGGILSVKMVCIQDTATHMTGDYEVYDFFTGYYKVYESGTFDLNLVPAVI